MAREFPPRRRRCAVAQGTRATSTRYLFLIVPTLCVGMHPVTLCVTFQKRNAERPWRHSHAGAWERSICIFSLKNHRVAICSMRACSRWGACRSCRRLRSFDLGLSLPTQLSGTRSQPRCTRQLLHSAAQLPRHKSSSQAPLLWASSLVESLAPFLYSIRLPSPARTSCLPAPSRFIGKIRISPATVPTRNSERIPAHIPGCSTIIIRSNGAHDCQG